MHGEALERLKENVCDYIAKIGMEEINERNLEAFGLAVDAYKDLVKVEYMDCELEEMRGGSKRRYRDEYSERRYSRGEPHYDDGGDSYKRDSMGRYTRENRDDSRKQLREQAEILMRQAETPHEKDIARRFLELLEKE